MLIPSKFLSRNTNNNIYIEDLMLENKLKFNLF